MSGGSTPDAPQMPQNDPERRKVIANNRLDRPSTAGWEPRNARTEGVEGVKVLG